MKIKKVLALIMAVTATACIHANETYGFAAASIPMQTLKVDDMDTTVESAGAAINGGVIWIFDSKLYTKVDASIGAVFSNDFGTRDSYDLGTHCIVAGGVGYSLISGEKLDFTVGGLIGLDFFEYEMDYHTVEPFVQYELKDSSLCFITGLDTMLLLHLGEEFGLYANLKIYANIGGLNEKLEPRYYSSHASDEWYKTMGMTIMPSVGLTMKL